MNNEWRILYDGSGAKAIDDPTGATYTFVRIVNGKIVEREFPRHGFCYNASKNLKTILLQQLEALDKPWVVEETKTELKEMNG